MFLLHRAQVESHHFGFARLDVQLPVNGFQKRGLSRAYFAYQINKFTLVLFKVDAFQNLQTLLAARNMDSQVIVRQSGCMGCCADEPTVEVVVPGMETVIYGKVTPALAKDIVQTHLIDKKLLDNLIVERLAPSK